MILLDTSILSEAVRGAPSPSVIRWLNAQQPSQVYISAVTLAEIAYGLYIMPPGRRDDLRIRVKHYLDNFFPQPVPAFDEASARMYAEIKEARREMGRPMSDFDGQIAAIARVNGLALATRNVRDFEGVGLDLIDPFETSS